jgi:hypothetical protein
MNPVTSADTGNFWIRCKMALYPLQPIRAGRGIVIRYRHNIATAARQTCIKRRHLTWHFDQNNLQGKPSLPGFRQCNCLIIASTRYHQNLVGSPDLRSDRVKAPQKILRAAIRRNKNRNPHFSPKDNKNMG